MSNRTPTLLVCFFAAALSAGCASWPAMPAPPGPVSMAMPTDAGDEDRFHLDLIEKMLDDGRSYAALAHLDALEPELAERPDAGLLRAETLRRLGQMDRAQVTYLKLLDTEAAAMAHRGLGLLAADAGDDHAAVRHLERARDLRPTAPRIRNDLGYALMLVGAMAAAEIELATAMELGEAHRAARNLVLMLLVEGKIHSAERVAMKHEIGEATLAGLNEHAQALREHLGQGEGS